MKEVAKEEKKNKAFVSELDRLGYKGVGEDPTISIITSCQPSPLVQFPIKIIFFYWLFFLSYPSFFNDNYKPKH